MVSNKDFSFIFQSITDCVLALSDRGQILFANKAAESCFFLSNQIDGMAFALSDLGLPSSISIVSLIEGKKPISVEVEFETSSAAKNRFFSWSIQPCSFENAQHAILLIGRDITELKCAKDKIFELDSVIAQTPGNLYWFDNELTYLGCNENSAKTLHMTREEAVGQNFRELMKHVETTEKSLVDTFVAQGLQVISTGEPLLDVEEPPFRGPDGESHYYLANKVPLKNREGKVYGAIGISTDITLRKELEESLRKQREKAEVASRSKSEFIANMSHDIRTPITGILGMAQNMLETANEAGDTLKLDKKGVDLSSGVSDIIAIVQENSQYLIAATNELLQLCNDILDVVRLESGKVAEKAESFDLLKLLNQTIDLLKPVAKNRNVDLSLHLNFLNTPRYVSGIRIYLNRILLNLLSNALKFTSSGYVKLHVNLLDDSESDENSDNKVFLEFRVEDTGIGIPSDKFEVIFEHFSRLNPSYEGQYKGTGLGLYTIKRYVSAMRGSINLDSEVGKGTCFTVTLPFEIADSVDCDNAYASFPQKKEVIDNPSAGLVEKILQSSSYESSDVSILIVEDNRLAAIALRLALKPFKCKVDVADCGKKGVELALQNEYDLIFMDIGLPDFSGVEVTKKIRASQCPHRSAVPIVAVTGHADNTERRQEAFDAGMQAVIAKPAKIPALESVFHRFIFELGDATTNDVFDNDEVSEDCSDVPKIVDWDACIVACNEDSDLALEMLLVLEIELKDSCRVLNDAYEDRDTKKLREELHRILGGLCYLKLPDLEAKLKSFHKEVKAVPQNDVCLERTYLEFRDAADTFLSLCKDRNFK